MGEILVTSSLTAEMWKENKGGGWAVLIVVCFILLWQLIKFLFSAVTRRSILRSSSNYAPLIAHPMSTSGISDLIPEGDLKSLIDNLDEKTNETEKWEHVIDKSKGALSYKAKCCKPKDAPLKYVSVTMFENCSPEELRDFYMDCEFRKQWDKTVVQHEQLQIDERSGIEIGQTLKKFPLLSPREYVLSWKIWEGSNRTFYCFTKECEHPSAPRQKKYVRVAFFRSGWRIRQVPGRNACEIKMVHQEDAGLNVEVAKLVFAKGIWSYVCKMNDALHKHASFRHPQSNSAVTAVSLIQKVPPELDAMSGATLTNRATTSGANYAEEDSRAVSRGRKKRPSKKAIANGLLLLGGIICLSHGGSGLCAKVAVAFVMKKFSRRGGPTSTQS